MKLTKESFIEKTALEFSKIGQNLTEKQLERLYEYKELLLEWNEKINLTAITDDEEIIIKHLVDSAYALQSIPNGSKVIDVGTGAGLPGMVLAICNDNIQVLLLDALQKRVAFLNEVIEKLELKNVTAVHARAEDAARAEAYREMFDISISRAVASLNVLMEITVPFVKKASKCIYMKADKLGEEMKQSKNAERELALSATEIKEYELSVAGVVLKHNLAIYTKNENTSGKYPRQFAKIKKSPL